MPPSPLVPAQQNTYAADASTTVGNPQSVGTSGTTQPNPKAEVQGEESKVANQGSTKTSEILARRKVQGLSSLKISSLHQKQNSDPDIPLLPLPIEEEPDNLKPSDEVLRNQRARAGSENFERGETTHTPLSNTVHTPGSAKEYEAKRQAMIDANIATDFQVLELERDLKNKDAPSKGSKVSLGAGGTAKVYAVRLHHAYGEYGKTFAFKQLLDTRNLPNYMKASIERMAGANPETAKQTLIQSEKRKIINEYSHHAAVHYIDQIPKVYGLFELDGGLGILMELMDGPDAQWLQQIGQVALAYNKIGSEEYLKIVLRAIADILIPLAEMHKLNLIHSDVKPENVKWSHEEKMFKLMDHGGGRQVGEKVRVFSPGYGELSGGSSRNLTLADPRGDIYQTGQTLHFLLTGRTVGTCTFEDGERGESKGERIPFIKALQGLDSNIKDQLADLLNGMISEESDDKSLRQSAEDLLKMPLFEMISDRVEIEEKIQKLKKWSEGGD